MGRIVEESALKKGHTIKAIIDPTAEGATHKEINSDSLNGVDVAIEFSVPEIAIRNIELVAKEGVNLVMATTGWYGQIEKVRKIVKNSGIGFIYASNFSIGVNIFYGIVEAAARRINLIDSYDVFGYELHHNRKQDSPSGTAKSIGEILLSSIDRKKKIVEDKLDRKIKDNEIHFASVRGGDIPGTHVVGFDSTADTIELKHTARNRDGFALGSVLAGEWLNGKKGFFEIQDFMNDFMKELMK